MSAATSLSAGPSPPPSLRGCSTGACRGQAQSTVLTLQRFPGGNGVPGSEGRPEGWGGGGGWELKGSPKGLVARLGDSSTAAPAERPGVPGPEAKEEASRPSQTELAIWGRGLYGNQRTRGKSRLWHQTDGMEFWEATRSSLQALIQVTWRPIPLLACTCGGRRSQWGAQRVQSSRHNVGRVVDNQQMVALSRLTYSR